MYLVDAMDGFQFEDFLVEIFQTMDLWRALFE